ncbi:MAG: deaminase [Candidatus Pacebacteria bacterium]|nr:deaminase [Candidatus Paceibacterota bacterium]MBT4652311.1 deaminase [Candidatus Paceibacterota bacterium]MBT6756138.1 deaminase [Candidatus Paceibacterota bacterium]MBT6921757.1 deaminase [Candidatus Paceibacterota bacterium]
MSKNRSFTTLFLMESLDGKISTGDTDNRDVDKDFPLIDGVKEGLHQYYDIEKTTDPFSLNTGRVMAKIGLNTKNEEPTKIGCSFIIIDNKPHLTEKGTEYLAKWVKHLYLVTTNENHPAFKLKEKHSNITILKYEEKIDLTNLLERMNGEHGAEKITIQSGGTLNSAFIRQGLIDKVSIVIAPCLIGGSDTASLVGGESLKTKEDLEKIKPLRLVDCKKLDNSYVHLVYEVVNGE